MQENVFQTRQAQVGCEPTLRPSDKNCCIHTK
jgi:hypothetical protein